MAESKIKFTTETLLEKITPEKCWEITAKILSAIYTIRGDKIIAPALGKDEGVFAPVWGWEKFREIDEKVIKEAGRQSIPMVKEMFNIPVEDAIGMAKLFMVSGKLVWGPEVKYRIVEATPERAIFRWTQCPWWNRFKEFEVDPAFRFCHIVHQAGAKAGLKAVNPKTIYTLTKAMPWGDPYCEDVVEFRDD